MKEQTPATGHPPIQQEILPIRSFITKEQRQKKKRLIRRIIIFCLCLIPFFIWLQNTLFKKSLELPVNSNIIIFALININVILLLIVLFLILRNLAELLFERKLNILGSRLRTKLVISFLSLSLIPTIFLFFVALQFVSSSVDYWFNASIENSLQESLSLAQTLIQDAKDQTETTGAAIAERLEKAGTTLSSSKAIEQFLKETINQVPEGIPLGLTIIYGNNQASVSALTNELQGTLLPGISVTMVQNVIKRKSVESIIQDSNKGDLIRNIRSVSIDSDNKSGMILVTTALISSDKLAQMTQISQGIEDYRQRKHLKGPFKFWLLLFLLIVTLLIIFAAIWFGIKIAHSITEPVDKLVRATRRISDGDFNFSMDGEIANDEIGQLVSSFNAMTANINSSNMKLAKTHRALEESYLDSDRRRKYTEIILQNVSAGVISLDDHGRITTINHFAEKLLGIDRRQYINMTYREALPAEYTLILDRFMEELYVTSKLSIEQHLKVTINRNTLSLLINFTRLEDDDGRPLGFVLVFDNLTKLEKMQRMAAWREVARRIAHEIKNPLTPIQLSAQRLRRRYPEILTAKDSIFDQCTRTIINQVDELKRLVSEFSQFARMPKINKARADLTKLAQETLILYREGHKHITFTCTAEQTIPPFNFDAEQIKRCIINLIDNAVAVLDNGGNIDISIKHHPESDTILLFVADNGPGISKNNKQRLFEPYFSTKKSGTGLGLAIVSTIVSDHGGYIRVQDNTPHGSIFVLELPFSETPFPEHSHNEFHNDY